MAGAETCLKTLFGRPGSSIGVLPTAPDLRVEPTKTGRLLPQICPRALMPSPLLPSNPGNVPQINRRVLTVRPKCRMPVRTSEILGADNPAGVGYPICRRILAKINDHIIATAVTPVAHPPPPCVLWPNTIVSAIPDDER